jgi:hypothetical protein
MFRTSVKRDAANMCAFIRRFRSPTREIYTEVQLDHLASTNLVGTIHSIDIFKAQMSSSRVEYAQPKRLTILEITDIDITPVELKSHIWEGSK